MRLEWNNKALEAKVERILIANAWKAAQREEQKLKSLAPVYHGPERSSKRAPGTMRDGIKAVKMKKWSKVVIPHPAIFVEYGGRVLGKDGGYIGKRQPQPFIQPTLKPLLAYLEKLHENMI